MKRCTCPKCGNSVDKPGRLCDGCTTCTIKNKSYLSENPNFLLTSEIHESNYSTRLAEGFAMMNGDY
jgi:hypothetical protein